jgi:putative endonuclease
MIHLHIRDFRSNGMCSRIRHVKTRSSTGAGHPADAIDDRKEQRMTQGALAYLKSHRLLNHAARFDVVAVTWPANAK